MKIKKISKTAWAAIIIILALAIAFAVFLPLYLKNNEENRELYKEQKIKINAYGEEIGSYTIDELLAIEGITETDFAAIFDTSSSEPIEKTYTGIELKKVLTALGININNARTVSLKASDGAVKIYDPKDVRKSDNVFITYKVNGKSFTSGIDGLGHTRETEDGGPFVVIRVSDTFSNNRCKLLTEVTVE